MANQPDVRSSIVDVHRGRTDLKVLVTGATGFVGTALIARLAPDPGLIVRAAVRRDKALSNHAVERVTVGELAAQTDWRRAVAGMDAVVHLAARVHVMRDVANDPLAEFRRTNLDGTLRLARQAAESGVRRFIFLSSIKVNGECTTPRRPFTAEDPPAPEDPYGVSKHEAETGLRELASETGMELVIIRPVLVYGPGVKGNFHSMMRWLVRGVPLPFGAIHNRRSLVAVGNLVDLVAICLWHPGAANQVFLVSDGDDLSTTDLLRRTAMALGRTARLIPVPKALLEGGALLLRKRAMARRLWGSLQVDIRKTRERLDWTPPMTVDDGLRSAADDFLGAGGVVTPDRSP